MWRFLHVPVLPWWFMVLKPLQRALCLRRTLGDALSPSRREKALQQVLHAQCLFLFMSMLNTKWIKPSRSTRKASIVWCQVKEASSRALWKLLRAKPKCVCVCVCVCVRVCEVFWGSASGGGSPGIVVFDVRQHLCLVGLVSGGLPVPGK